MKYLKAFAWFWYDFIVGDDWRVAVTIAAALGLTAILVDAGVSAWWLMPLAVVLALAWSLRRATRRLSGYR
jgi:ribonucleotide monophosphatase NagD (HAD superfamily)